MRQEGWPCVPLISRQFSSGRPVMKLHMKLRNMPLQKCRTKNILANQLFAFKVGWFSEIGVWVTWRYAILISSFRDLFASLLKMRHIIYSFSIREIKNRFDAMRQNYSQKNKNRCEKESNFFEKKESMRCDATSSHRIDSHSHKSTNRIEQSEHWFYRKGQFQSVFRDFWRCLEHLSNK